MENQITEKCSVRITKALSIRGMKQSDLCAKTGIPKSAVSQYISGAFEPKQDRLFAMAQALDVNPVWLMGFDVPIDAVKEKSPGELALTEGEKEMLELFRQIPPDRQSAALEILRAAIKMQ